MASFRHQSLPGQGCLLIERSLKSIPTVAVLAELRKEGFQPFMSCQTHVCVEGEREHTEHMLRLYLASPFKGAEANEIVLLNSQDGTSNWRCGVSNA
ncbi:DUF932 domain-containing protein [Yersinia enterocolitica]|nr:DUF932 domain-containing protein [Yersinia enterocolitica]ELI8153851.1 DUF932 domain-containing protein [Yersinia enterocolitica]ELI8335577.1 DUF932 domain-containing protein [Yersinia enterocolitica]